MKNKSSNIFIQFTDFRGPIVLRASAIDGFTPQEKDKATTIYLNGSRLTVELPYEVVAEAISEAAYREYLGQEAMILLCPKGESQKMAMSPTQPSKLVFFGNPGAGAFHKRYSEHGEHLGGIERDAEKVSHETTKK